jgi:broad specificity phosphatase PhoE
MVSFDPEMTAKDEQWKPDERETLSDVEKRVHAVLSWLVQQGQDNIVVVSHGVWIEVCLQLIYPAALTGGRRVYNCDGFACQVVSCNGRFVRFESVTQIVGHGV